MERVLEIKKGIKNLIPAICFLNIFDGILTFVGVKSGYCVEVNPIIRQFIDSASLVLLFKIAIPTILFWLVFKMIDKGVLSFPKTLILMFRGTLGVYIFIAINHIFVLGQLWYYNNIF